jgi:hypothetical protein
MFAGGVCIAGLLFGTASPAGSSVSFQAIECQLCELIRSTPGAKFTAVAYSNGGPRRIILPDKPEAAGPGSRRDGSA